jgi:hypothetical protein
MTSHAIAGGLSADHQLPGVPKARKVLLNKLIHSNSTGPPEKVTQQRLVLLPITQFLPARCMIPCAATRRCWRSQQRELQLQAAKAAILLA